jgi:hypothetical protein
VSTWAARTKKTERWGGSREVERATANVSRTCLANEDGSHDATRRARANGINASGPINALENLVMDAKSERLKSGEHLAEME